MKKIILLIAVLVFSCSAVMAQGWKVVSSPDIKQNINDIFFVSEDEGWIACDSGAVYHTINGGTDWIRQNTNTSKTLKKICFINRNYGWIGTIPGSILITTNSGETWTESSFAKLVPNIAFTYFDAVCFTNASTGFIVAGKDKAVYLFKTTDGGLNWVKKDSLVSTLAQRWYDIAFYDQNKGVLMGDKKDNIRYTTDGGEKWNSTSINDNFFGMIKSVKWLSATDVIAIGEGSEFNGLPTPVYKSTNGGAAWVKQNTTGIYDRAKESFFKDAQNGIAVGSNGFSKMFYMKTSDGGATWTSVMGKFPVGLQAVTGVGDRIYAIGTDNHIFRSSDFGSTWTMLQMKNQSPVYCIEFKGNKGFIINKASDVLINQDGKGNSWSYLSSSGVWEAYAASFFDANTGIVMKDNKHIVKTTDGGKSWITVMEPVQYNNKNRVGGLSFPDQNTGYAWMSLNDYGEYHIYKTTDGGNKWNEAANFTGPGYISGNMGFFDANTGVIAGPKGWIGRTANGGTTWDSVTFKNVPPNIAKKDFEDLCIVNNTTAWAVCEKAIYVTSDKGLTWNYVDHAIKNTDSTFYTVSFYGGNTGYISCFDGTIIKTTDAGKSWSVDETFKGIHHFYSSAFNESGKIFFGTSNGLIITTAGNEVSVNDKPSSVPGGYLLAQNYPNPFNPSTSINFSLPADSRVRIVILDVLGRELETAADGFFKAGTHSISINLSNFSSGVYYYQLNAGSFSGVKKMMLLK
ncbi:MAG: YCF48-related protein [Ignavibacteriales bacterium]